MKSINYLTIHHNAFATSDIIKTIRYWRDLLGFKMVLSYGTKGRRQFFFAINPQLFIVFFEWATVLPIQRKRHGEEVSGPFIFDHMAIGVESLKDLSALQERFINNDFVVSDIIDHGFLYSIYTFDPNGIPLEFNCLNPEVNLFKNPVLTNYNEDSQLTFSDPQPEIWNWEEEDEDEMIILPGEGHELF